MALVTNDTVHNGKTNDFEVKASYLLPHDTVIKKIAAGTRRGMAKISVTSGSDASSASSAKPSTGKTGVDFSFYERGWYNQLTEDQKHKLREHCNNQSAKKGNQGNKTNKGTKKWDKSTKKMIAAALSKKLEEKRKEAQINAADDEKI